MTEERKMSDGVCAKVDQPGLLAVREGRRYSSLGEAFADLRRLCVEEGYTLDIPTRSNRDSEFDPFS